jgi:hypothetical protein
VRDDHDHIHVLYIYALLVVAVEYRGWSYHLLGVSSCERGGHTVLVDCRGPVDRWGYYHYRS